MSQKYGRVYGPRIDTIWASFWGMLYRKFFFDFVTGIVRAPGGVQ